MKTAVIAALAGAALLASTFAEAQAPTRIRGTIGAVSGSVITVNAAGGKSVEVQFNDATRLVFAQPIAMTDIKSGDFLGVTSVKHKDGTLRAYDVRRFPKPVNPGHRPFDGRDDQAVVDSRERWKAYKAAGHTLTYWQQTATGGWEKKG